MSSRWAVPRSRKRGLRWGSACSLRRWVTRGSAHLVLYTWERMLPAHLATFRRDLRITRHSLHVLTARVPPNHKGTLNSAGRACNNWTDVAEAATECYAEMRSAHEDLAGWLPDDPDDVPLHASVLLAPETPRNSVSSKDVLEATSAEDSRPHASGYLFAVPPDLDLILCLFSVPRAPSDRQGIKVLFGCERKG